MTATITQNAPQSRTKWADDVYTQHFDENVLKMLTQEGDGTGIQSGVITKENFEVGEGAKKIYNFRQDLSLSSVKRGEQRLQGTGVDIARGTDELLIDWAGAETGVRNRTMSAQRTKIDLQKDAGDALANQAGRWVAREVLNQLTDTSTGRTQKRYVYGSSEGNWNATHATAMGNVDGTDDKLSLRLLSGVKTKMITQSTGLGFMRPAKVMTKSGASVNKFVGMFHPRAIRDLKQDADFRTDVFNKENPEFDVISGANFVGEYEGILLFSMPPIDTENDIQLVTGAGASSIDVAHNLILGQGAAVIGYGKIQPPAGNTKHAMQSNSRMMLTTIDDDHGRNALFAWQMNMAVKKLVDNSTGVGEDFGTFHLFTAAGSGLGL